MSATQVNKCRVPQAFWRAIERLGLRPEALLRQARLPGTLHLPGQRPINTEHYFALWKALEALTGDAAIALRLVEETDTSAHPPSSFASFFAKDYRDALIRTARFKHLCTPEQLHLTENGDEVSISIEWLYATDPEPPVLTDVAFASLVELGRRGTKQRLTPHRVEFTRAGPVTEKHKAYFGCPIRYKTAKNVLVLKGSDLDRPFPGHNPELLEILTPALAAALGDLEACNSISEQVKVLLKRKLASGRPDLPEVAQELGMSERTLQRRVTDEGKNFRELLIEARQELGRRLLADPSAEIDEVAYLLGFQDTSSFHRAFRDWEGVTPNRWRQLNAAESQATKPLIQ
jgi:AraC-like DNA-binding protein